MKEVRQWIPGPVRAEVPERILVRYRAVAPAPGERTLEHLRELIEGVPVLSGVGIEGVDTRVSWTRSTRVFGLIQRETEEEIEIYLTGGASPSLELLCAPQRLHDAHAAGFAGILAFTAAAGITAGPPAAVATLLGGSLLAVTAREHALLALRRQLGTLARELGEGLWPGVPAELDWVEV